MSNHHTINLYPIGYFHSQQQKKYEVPKQPLSSWQNEGVIKLNPHSNFEQALEGLEEFDRLWIVFWFHQCQGWKPKVLPPRGFKKRGVFATRSPHRPNAIGLSCVKLKAIKGLNLFIENHDLLDGTPILDIKPYLNHADSFVSEKQGWLDDLDESGLYEVLWSEEANRQLNYLKLKWNLDLMPGIHLRLHTQPLPYPNNRIKHLTESSYLLAYKSWRVVYEVDKDSKSVNVLFLSSGYDKDTLQGLKQARWDDVPIHIDFTTYFQQV